MPVDQLDPRTALVLIDLQKGITSLPTETPGDVIVQRAAQLATAFQSKVTVTSVAPIVASVGRSAGPIDSTDPPEEHIRELKDARAYLEGQGIQGDYVPAVGQPHHPRPLVPAAVPYPCVHEDQPEPVREGGVPARAGAAARGVRADVPGCAINRCWDVPECAIGQLRRCAGMCQKCPDVPECAIPREMRKTNPNSSLNSFRPEASFAQLDTPHPHS